MRYYPQRMVDNDLHALRHQLRDVIHSERDIAGGQHVRNTTGRPLRHRT